MTYALLLSALAMGFFGSPHCLGMCGGIVTAFGLSMQKVSPTKKRWLISAYHLGRLSSYMALGALAYIVGATLLAPFLVGNGLPRLILGIALAFCGLLMLGLPILSYIERLGLRLWQRLAPLRSRLFPLDSTAKAYSAGLLWGLLPCGMVYGALMVAVGAGTGIENPNILTGMAFMFVFGLGTLPMLLATQSTVGFLQRHIKRFSLRKLSGAVLLLSGMAVAASPLMHTLGGHSNHAHPNNSHTPTQQTTAPNSHTDHTHHAHADSTHHH